MEVLEENPGKQLTRGGGAFLMLINIADLMPIDSFKAKVDEWVCTLKQGKLQKGFDEILLPGEMAQREEQDRLANGVPIQEHYWNGRCEMAKELNIDLES